jgi:hypothetical protein
LGECFEVLPVTPTLSTTAWSTGAATGSAQTTPVDFGSPLYDKASLSGAATQPGTNGGTTPGVVGSVFPSIDATNGAAAGGQIAFTLKGPDDPTATPPVCSTTNAAKLANTTGSNPENVTVSGNGSYFTSGFTPAAPGPYHWVAAYSPATGDPNNIGSTHNADCSNTTENVTVRQIPTEIRTKQSWFPNDTAQIKSTVTGDAILAGGTVDFFLYNNATCLPGTADANLKYSERVTIAAGHISGGVAEVNTSNYTGSTGVKPGGGAVAPFSITTGYADAAASSSGSYSWKVVYTPAGSDQVHTGKQSACTSGSTETFSITYTNDNSGGSNLP